MRSQRRRSTVDNLKLLDDIARAATGALGSFSEIRHQIKSVVRQRVEELVAAMDLVTRDEFDRVEALAARARDRQEELEERLAVLEGKKPAKAKTTARKKTSPQKRQKK